MIVLGIESAIVGGSISLLHDEVELDAWAGDADVARAENLLPNIAGLLAKHSIEPANIDVIAVSRGPGSFTGIRIGLATVLGLRASLGVRCVAMSALEAMAFEANSPHVIAAVPVGRRNAAIQEFLDGAAVAGPRLVPEDDIVSQLGSTDEARAIIHGDLYSRFFGGAVGPPVIDAGYDLARLIARASGSGFAGTDLAPLFLTRTAQPARG
jgi:tRNA threonylcarbamoyladenosine biosynthesis protein TsaB